MRVRRRFWHPQNDDSPVRPGQAGQGLSGALAIRNWPLGTRVGNRSLLPFARQVRAFAKSHDVVMASTNATYRLTMAQHRRADRPRRLSLSVRASGPRGGAAQAGPEAPGQRGADHLEGRAVVDRQTPGTLQGADISPGVIPRTSSCRTDRGQKAEYHGQKVLRLLFS